jgi:hypothetical protein
MIGGGSCHFSGFPTAGKEIFTLGASDDTIADNAMIDRSAPRQKRFVKRPRHRRQFASQFANLRTAGLDQTFQIAETNTGRVVTQPVKNDENNLCHVAQLATRQMKSNPLTLFSKDRLAARYRNCSA